MNNKTIHIKFESLIKLYRRELSLKEVHRYKQHLHTCADCSNMLKAIEAFETTELIQPKSNQKKWNNLFNKFSFGLKYVNAVAACFLLFFVLNVSKNEIGRIQKKIMDIKISLRHKTCNQIGQSKIELLDKKEHYKIKYDLFLNQDKANFQRETYKSILDIDEQPIRLANGSNFGLLDGGDAKWSYLAAKDDYTAFIINHIEMTRIKDNGYVGIGTTTPQYILEENGSALINVNDIFKRQQIQIEENVLHLIGLNAENKFLQVEVDNLSKEVDHLTEKVKGLTTNYEFFNPKDMMMKYQLGNTYNGDHWIDMDQFFYSRFEDYKIPTKSNKSLRSFTISKIQKRPTKYSCYSVVAKIASGTRLPKQSAKSFHENKIAGEIGFDSIHPNAYYQKDITFETNYSGNVPPVLDKNQFILTNKYATVYDYSNCLDYLQNCSPVLGGDNKAANEVLRSITKAEEHFSTKYNITIPSINSYLVRNDVNYINNTGFNEILDGIVELTVPTNNCPLRDNSNSESKSGTFQNKKFPFYDLEECNYELSIADSHSNKRFISQCCIEALTIPPGYVSGTFDTKGTITIEGGTNINSGTFEICE